MATDGFSDLHVPAPRSVTVDGVEVGRGSQVVLRPGPGADMFGEAMAGMLATVEAIHEDLEGKVHLAVTLEDDPGRELGEQRRPGHRFFFSPAEVEPLAGAPPPPTRVLVAGIGNVFFADDGFGVAVAKALEGRERPRGVDVVDFGIRGMDLVFALGEGYDIALFVDAVPRGEEPGTGSFEPQHHSVCTLAAPGRSKWTHNGARRLSSVRGRSSSRARAACRSTPA